MPVYANIDEAKADGVIHFWAFDNYDNDRFEDYAGGWHAQALNVKGHDVAAACSSGIEAGLNTAFHGNTDKDDMIQVVLPSLNDSVTTLLNWTAKFRFFFDGRADPSAGANGRLLGLGNIISAGGDNNNSLRMELQSAGTNSGDDMAHVNSYIQSYGFIQHPTNIRQGNWYDLTVRCDNGVVQVFNRLAPLSNTLTNTGLKLYANEGRIGFSSASDLWQYRFNGIISELIIWDRALANSEVHSCFELTYPYTSYEVIPIPTNTAPQRPNTPLGFPNVSPVRETTFKAILTGEANSTSDLELKISSFNGRKRSGRESYLSVVMPETLGAETEIIERNLGDIVVFTVIEGVETELMRVNYADLRIDRGPNSATLTLSGTKQSTNEDPLTKTLEDCLYYRNQITSTSLRFPISSDVQPADTLDYNGSTHLIDEISYIGSVGNAYMELKA